MSEHASVAGRSCVASIAVLLSSTACAIGPQYVRPRAPAPPAYQRGAASRMDRRAAERCGARVASGGSVFHERGLDALEAAGEHLESERACRGGAVPGRAGRRARHRERPVSGRHRRAVGDARPEAETTRGAAASTRCPSTCRTRPTCGAAFGAASRPTRPSRRRPPRILKTRGCCISRNSRPTTSRSRDSTPSAGCSRTRSSRTNSTVQLTQDRFQGGVVSMADVALAQTQLEGARAQLTDLGIARAQFEHAIAVLTGHAARRRSRSRGASQAAAAGLPVGLPSTLLERRPDIAAAERRVAAANQQIGVARAAFFPALSFGGSAWLAGRSHRRSVHGADARVVDRRAAGGDPVRRRQAPRPGQADRGCV